MTSKDVMFNGLRVGEAQRACVSPLKDAGIDEPVLEARLLVGFVLGGGPERVLMDRDEMLSDTQASKLSVVLAQRSGRMPMAQILGVREFWSLPFKVTSATLSPRPDSETIVEAALNHVSIAPATVLDLGTGTGCLVLALLSEWKNARGTAVDVSAETLSVATENAKVLDLSARVKWLQNDWTIEGWMESLGGPFDVVVSNPPYIPSADIAGLDADVRAYEPLGALDGGVSGLDAYRILCAALPRLLTNGGLAVFEVGIGQGDDVTTLMEQAGLDVIEQRQDLGGIVRAIVGRNTPH
ncbi:MAG: peptide chain release factor N(5)-glutamine methyltransferase [Magnetovibrio sp.]|nr:peptide chain release factor N(5)-glutamine methyltransferase [Magnetovibrio sp.]